MKPLKDITVTVCDSGLFVFLAGALGPHVKKVYYCNPCASAFPKSAQLDLGTGYKEFEKILDWHSVVDETDLFVFPDIYYAGVQLDLEARGKLVWGSRKGEKLETERVWSKRLMEGLGLAVGGYYVMNGIEALKKHLKTHSNQYIKISATRGDAETQEAEEYDLVEGWIDDLASRLGARRDTQEFVCEDKIPDAIEMATDCYTVDGKFPKRCMWGIEAKATSYIGLTGAPPKQLTELNEKLSKLFAKTSYRNFWAMEGRITKDGVIHPIDACCRMGSPPGELVTLMYENLAEIMYMGAQGVLVEPKFKARYGVELMIHSSWLEKGHPVRVKFPPRLAPYVKLRNSCVRNGAHFVLPQGDNSPSLGGVVAVGDTLDAAIKKCKLIADKVRFINRDVDPDSLDKSVAELKKLGEYGLQLG